MGTKIGYLKHYSRLDHWLSPHW